jgi:hypothetical protein
MRAKLNTTQSEKRPKHDRRECWDCHTGNHHRLDYGNRRLLLTGESMLLADAEEFREALKYVARHSFQFEGKTKRNKA